MSRTSISLVFIVALLTLFITKLFDIRAKTPAGWLSPGPARLPFSSLAGRPRRLLQPCGWAQKTTLIIKTRAEPSYYSPGSAQSRAVFSGLFDESALVV